jgi:hypothetical protein
MTLTQSPPPSRVRARQIARRSTHVSIARALAASGGDAMRCVTTSDFHPATGARRIRSQKCKCPGAAGGAVHLPRRPTAALLPHRQTRAPSRPPSPCDRFALFVGVVKELLKWRRDRQRHHPSCRRPLAPELAAVPESLRYVPVVPYLGSHPVVSDTSRLRL